MDELETMKAEVTQAFLAVFKQVDGQPDVVKELMAKFLVDMMIEKMGEKVL